VGDDLDAGEFTDGQLAAHVDAAVDVGRIGLAAGDRIIAVGPEDGADALEELCGMERVEAEAFVVATGARPVELPGLAFGGDVWSAREAVALSEVPRRLAVIGGGVIGLELGTVYAKLGSQVTVVEALPQLSKTAKILGSARGVAMSVLLKVRVAMGSPLSELSVSVQRQETREIARREGVCLDGLSDQRLGRAQGNAELFAVNTQLGFQKRGFCRQYGIVVPVF